MEASLVPSLATLVEEEACPIHVLVVSVHCEERASEEACARGTEPAPCNTVLLLYLNDTVISLSHATGHLNCTFWAAIDVAAASRYATYRQHRRSRDRYHDVVDRRRVATIDLLRNKLF